MAFDLGLERAGHECVGQCEIDPYALKVLEKHWPDVPRFGDILAINPHKLPKSQLWTAGFPCQDISNAGKRKGIKGSRSGLFFWFMRMVREVCPEYILLENVSALLVRGMGEVLAELAGSGYDAEWRVLRASDFGAPHQRERVFIVAYRDGQRIEGGWKTPLSRQLGFSWCEGIRGVEDLQNRPDLPEPLIRRITHGLGRRVDCCGNAVVPQVAEYIGRLLKQAELERKTGTDND